MDNILGIVFQLRKSMANVKFPYSRCRLNTYSKSAFYLKKYSYTEYTHLSDLLYYFSCCYSSYVAIAIISFSIFHKVLLRPSVASMSISILFEIIQFFSHSFCCEARFLVGGNRLLSSSCVVVCSWVHDFVSLQ